MQWVTVEEGGLLGCHVLPQGRWVMVVTSGTNCEKARLGERETR